MMIVRAEEKPSGWIAAIHLNLDTKRFQKTYALARGANVGHRVAEVVLYIDGEEFETTFDDLVRVVRTLKKTTMDS